MNVITIGFFGYFVFFLNNPQKSKVNLPPSFLRAVKTWQKVSSKQDSLPEVLTSFSKLVFLLNYHNNPPKKNILKLYSSENKKTNKNSICAPVIFHFVKAQRLVAAVNAGDGWRVKGWFKPAVSEQDTVAETYAIHICSLAPNNQLTFAQQQHVYTLQGFFVFRPSHYIFIFGT